MKTGNTCEWLLAQRCSEEPQWSPVMKTGNTALTVETVPSTSEPQWSPVMKTGNTPDLTQYAKL